MSEGVDVFVLLGDVLCVCDDSISFSPTLSQSSVAKR